MIIAAPRPIVFSALSDYDNFSELSSRYLESRFVEPAADGTPRIYTEVEGCVLFFCRTVKRYARLSLYPTTTLIAIVEPEQSDIEYGREQWLLQAVPGGTRVLYSHEMDPDFWVPPLIGVWAIRRALTEDALTAAQRIEALALSNDVPASSDEQTDPAGRAESVE
jgi:hypothetical protein